LLDPSGDAAIFLLDAQFFFSVSALEELADVAADPGHHLDECFIRISDLPTEKL
jgi:hypothetical protein